MTTTQAPEYDRQAWAQAMHDEHIASRSLCAIALDVMRNDGVAGWNKLLAAVDSWDAANRHKEEEARKFGFSDKNA